MASVDNVWTLDSGTDFALKHAVENDSEGHTKSNLGPHHTYIHTHVYTQTHIHKAVTKFGRVWIMERR